LSLKASWVSYVLKPQDKLPLEDERLLRGAYLRKTVKYNPFLKPNLVDDPRLVYLDLSNIGEPLPKTNAENVKDIAKGVGTFFGIAAAMGN
jgi:hypothetical protein